MPLSIVFFLTALLAAGPAEALAQAQKAAPRTPDVIFVPTPHEVVEDMLRLVERQEGRRAVRPRLGGRPHSDCRSEAVWSARGRNRHRSCSALPKRRRTQRKRASRTSSSFARRTCSMSDFREATVVTLYLLARTERQAAAAALAELKPGTRIVSHQFDMGDWKAEKKLESSGRRIYFWTIPDSEEAALSTVAKPLRIEVASDVICPWCYIGKRRLAKALRWSLGNSMQASSGCRSSSIRRCRPQACARAEYRGPSSARSSAAASSMRV
jgi:hypothetical protein